MRACRVVRASTLAGALMRAAPPAAAQDSDRDTRQAFLEAAHAGSYLDVEMSAEAAECPVRFAPPIR